MTIPIIPDVAAIADHYDGYILDIWGVMHQGGAAYPEAIECVSQLRQHGKRVIFLSNAPRRASQVATVLADKGVTQDLYDAIVTSGEAAYQALAKGHKILRHSSSCSFHLLGPAYSADLLDGLNFESTDDISTAEFLLGIGLNEARKTVKAHNPVLAAAAKRDLPMICVNPDKLVIRLGEPELCAGALAEHYEELGGRVQYYGKPHPEVYSLALLALGIPLKRVLAVGDGLATDIRGAATAGIASLLVTGGLLGNSLSLAHGTAPDPQALEDACRRENVQPHAAVATFAWSKVPSTQTY